MADDILKGIQTGTQFAQAASGMKIQREEMDLEKERIATQKQQFKTKLGQTFYNQMTKIMETAPLGMRKARIKALKEQAAQHGITLSPVNEEAFQDEETRSNWVNATRFMAGLEPEQNDAMMAEVLDTMSKGDIAESIKILAKNEAEREQAALKGGTTKELQKMKGEQALEREEIKAVGAKEKLIEGQRVEREKKITNLQGNVGKISKEFEPVDRAFEQVMDIKRGKGGGVSNPQNRIALVRTMQALTEATKSVVRESEFKVVAKAAGLKDVALGFLEKWTVGQPVPLAVARDIVKAVEGFKLGVDRRKSSRLAPAIKDARRLKMGQDEWGSIFGTETPYNVKLRKAGQRKKAVSKGKMIAIKAIRKTLTRKNLNPAVKQKLENKLKSLLGAK